MENGKRMKLFFEISDNNECSVPSQQYKHKLLLKLKDLEEKRDFLRRQRRARDVPVITIVGYTNAGEFQCVFF